MRAVLSADARIDSAPKLFAEAPARCAPFALVESPSVYASVAGDEKHARDFAREAKKIFRKTLRGFAPTVLFF